MHNLKHMQDNQYPTRNVLKSSIAVEVHKLPCKDNTKLQSHPIIIVHLTLNYIIPL